MAAAGELQVPLWCHSSKCTSFICPAQNRAATLAIPKHALHRSVNIQLYAVAEPALVPHLFS